MLGLPAAADTGITMFQPRILEIVGFGAAIEGISTSAQPGPTNCPGATGTPDPNSVCSGMNVQIAINFFGQYVAVAAAPAGALRENRVSTGCVPGVWRSQFVQQITNTANPLLSRVDTRWGATLTVDDQCDLILQPPIP